ncbi:hypothetical protein [Burkholderia ubonensis]|uniref:hypothetical protein n=1 Tax=Burkholderia ubonensis TaxID=101571 RepID=UPI0012FBC5E5|nr:hypothetical protein [Burkholderia ubonensis]
MVRKTKEAARLTREAILDASKRLFDACAAAQDARRHRAHRRARHRGGLHAPRHACARRESGGTTPIA